MALQEAAARVSERHPSLKLLLNVAGILHIPEVMAPGKVAHAHAHAHAQDSEEIPVALTSRSAFHAETALARVSAFNLLTNFQINALGPILVSKVRPVTLALPVTFWTVVYFMILYTLTSMLALRLQAFAPLLYEAAASSPSKE